MSSLLTTVDLTGAVVGQKFKIDFSSYVKFNPMDIRQKAHLAFFNESGCGLSIVMTSSGDQIYVPAGLWGIMEIEPNDSLCNITVTYLLPNPPVSQLNTIYYAPSEGTPAALTLGNSPIGIGGTVNVSSVQTLSNEGGVTGTQVIDIGDVTLASLFVMKNDGTVVWQVNQSGVRHQVIKMQTAGTQLILGAAGDFISVASQLDSTGFITSTLGFVVPNVVSYWGRDANSTARPIMEIDASNLTTYFAAAANKFHWEKNDLATEGMNLDLSGTVNLLSLLGAFNSTIASISAIAGSVSGTLTTWQPFQGSSFKLVVMYWNNFQDASNRSIALQTAFANDMTIIVPADIGVTTNGGIQALVGAAAQNIDVVTSLAAAGGGGVSQNTIFKHSFGHINAAAVTVDHLQVLASTTAHSGIALFIGS